MFELCLHIYLLFKFVLIFFFGPSSNITNIKKINEPSLWLGTLTPRIITFFSCFPAFQVNLINLTLFCTILIKPTIDLSLQHWIATIFRLHYICLGTNLDFKTPIIYLIIYFILYVISSKRNCQNLDLILSLITSKEVSVQF